MFSKGGKKCKKKPEHKNLSVIPETAELEMLKKMKKDLRDLKEQDEKWLNDFKRQIPKTKKVEKELPPPQLFTDLKVSSRVFKPVISNSYIPPQVKRAKSKKKN